MPRKSSENRERVLNYPTRDISHFAMHTHIGYLLAQLKRGEWLRIHLYRNTDNSGNEHPCGPYQAESLGQQLEHAAKMIGVQFKMKVTGCDVLVGLK